MNQNQLFNIAVRILGVYMLVEAVMQIPTGVVEGILLLWFWFHRPKSPSDAYLSGMAYPTISIAIVSFILFAAVGAYLVMGAPHLFRLAGIKTGDKNPE